MSLRDGGKEARVRELLPGVRGPPDSEPRSSLSFVACRRGHIADLTSEQQDEGHVPSTLQSPWTTSLLWLLSLSVLGVKAEAAAFLGALGTQMEGNV